MRILQASNNYYNNITQVNTTANLPKTVNFMATAPKSKLLSPYSKLMDKMKTHIALKLTKILENKRVANIIEKTKKNKFLNDYLVSHFSALTSVVLSGFYIKKTLENEKLDPNKRRTLAINQGLVSVLSTILAYAIDGVTNKKVGKFTDKFMAANFTKYSEKALYNYKDGIGAASKMMIFGLIHRFVAPVFVTPLANHLGNKVNDKKSGLTATQKNN